MAEEQQDSGEKEFEASQTKIRKAREEGNVPQSRETNAFTLYIGMIISLFMFAGFVGQRVFTRLSALFHHAEDFSQEAFEPGSGATKIWTFSIVLDLLPILAILILSIGLTLVATQSITLSTKKIEPKFQNISPVDNLKKKYGAKGLIDFAKDAAKMLFAGGIAVVFLMIFMANYFGASAMTRSQIMPFTLNQLFLLVVIFLVFQGALAAIDLPIQWRLHANKLKMTREELKKETKESEGDPQLKRQRRDKAAQITNGDMLKNVGSATVVMVNPEHYAVALKWDPNANTAPILVAKGVDHLAAKIREVARENDVPIYRDPPAARSIYRLVEIDQEIQPEHFAAVAAAIQFVQSLPSKT